MKQYRRRLGAASVAVALILSGCISSSTYEHEFDSSDYVPLTEEAKTEEARWEHTQFDHLIDDVMATDEADMDEWHNQQRERWEESRCENEADCLDE